MFLSPARTKRRRRVGVLLSTALVAAGVSVMSTAGPAAAATGGAGAPVPYVHVEAENSATNGTALGPDYTYNTIEAEASGRRAVRLDATGEYVEFTVPSAANSMVVRLGIPDSATGSEYTAPLSLYINGTRQTDLTTTNKFSHLYGGYQFSNTPQGNHHWYFDEYQRLLPQMVAGTKVRIQKDATSSASSYTVDFMEFEQVAAALTQPAGSVSVTSQGADPTGVAESTNAFRAAIAAAGPGGTVWIPAGRFRVNGHTVVDNVTVRGAGMWHSIVTGTDPGFYGKWKNEGGSSNVTLSNFQISGNVIERCDSCQVNGIGGALSNSNISNIWIEHTKVGMWMDGPMDHLVFDRMRVRDQTADGVNFHLGVTNSTVSNSSFRNTADDAMAMWSESVANANNVFDNNTVEQTVWANGIAVYGGTSNSVTDNVVIDSGISQGGGIHVANRFASTPLAGTTNVMRNTIIRSGGLDPNWQFGVGSLWFDARDGAMNSSVVVDDLVIRNSPLEAIHFVSGGSITNVKISNVTIDGVGTFVVQAQVGGSATFTNVQATRIGQAATPVYNCTSFGMLNGGGNGAWFTAAQYSQCGQWPTPVIWPDSSGLSIAPSALDFGAQGTGSISAARAVAISNNGSAAISLSGIGTTGDFAQTNNCGTSLAGGASCTVNVTFHPTASGARSGTATITSNANNSPTTVALSGTGVGTDTNIAAGRTATASTQVNSTQAASTATDSDANTYWESNNNAFPQWLQVDLGAATSIGRVVLKLPPATAWATRTQTLSVQTSTDGSAFSTPVASATYTFNPASGNTVSIPVPATTARYVRINVTANSGWPAGQISELEVYPAGGTTTPTATLATNPDSLSFAGQALDTTSAAKAVTVSNTGSAAASVTGVAAGGDFSQTNTCGTSIAAGASCTVNVSFRPTVAGTRTGSLTITGSATNSPTTVALTGVGTGGTTSTNLAAGKATSESSHNDVYASSRVTDNDQGSYWESANNAFPQWVQVDLGSAQSAGRVVLQLPPTWGARNQTLTLQGSTNGANWSTLKDSASYSFAPAGNNSVTLTFTPTTQRYFRVTFTANTEWPAAQLSGFQVWTL